jgi:hypothetical protein
VSAEGTSRWKARIIVYGVLVALGLLMLAIVLPMMRRTRELERVSYMPNTLIDPETGRPLREKYTSPERSTLSGGETDSKAGAQSPSQGGRSDVH